jgi:hypothetical protein
MSAALTAGIVGTGFSVFSGLSSSKASKRALAQAEEQYRNNQAIASELKTRQQALVDAPLKQKIEEYSSRGLTTEGQQAMDKYRYDVGNINRQIQSQAGTVGEGLTGGRALNAAFQSSLGEAGIAQNDTINKNRQLQGYIGMAQQTPGWANLATNANTQMGNFYQGQAEENRADAKSAYASAAQGLAGLANMYSKGYRFGTNPNVSSATGVASDYPDLMSTEAQTGYQWGTGEKV